MALSTSHPWHPSALPPPPPPSAHLSHRALPHLQPQVDTNDLSPGGPVAPTVLQTAPGHGPHNYNCFMPKYYTAPQGLGLLHASNSHRLFQRRQWLHSGEMPVKSLIRDLRATFESSFIRSNSRVLQTILTSFMGIFNGSLMCWGTVRETDVLLWYIEGIVYRNVIMLLLLLLFILLLFS